MADEATDQSNVNDDAMADRMEQSLTEEPTQVEAQKTETETPPAEDNAEKSDDKTEEAANPDAAEGETTEEPAEGEEADNPNESEQTEEKSKDEVAEMSEAERRQYYYELRQAQKQKVEEAVNEAYQPQPQDELVQYFQEQGYDDFQSQMLARETIRDQQAKIAESRAEMAELNAGLATDAMDVVNSIDWLNATKQDSYDEKSTDLATTLYEQLAITKDPNTGQIIEAKMSPKQFYNAINQLRNSGIAEAQLKAQKTAEKQMAAVAPGTSTAPPSKVNADDKQASGMERALGNIR